MKRNEQTVCDQCGGDDPRYFARNDRTTSPGVYCEACAKPMALLNHGSAETVLRTLISVIEEARFAGLSDGELSHGFALALTGTTSSDSIGVEVSGPQTAVEPFFVPIDSEARQTRVEVDDGLRAVFAEIVTRDLCDLADGFTHIVGIAMSTGTSEEIEKGLRAAVEMVEAARPLERLARMLLDKRERIEIDATPGTVADDLGEVAVMIREYLHEATDDDRVAETAALLPRINELRGSLLGTTETGEVAARATRATACRIRDAGAA